MTGYWICGTPLGVFAWLAGIPVPPACEALLGSVQPLHLVTGEDYALLLGGTLALEMPLWLAWAWARKGNTRDTARAGAWALVANLTSHPVFVFLWLRLAHAWAWPVGMQLGVGEALVIGGEALLVKRAFPGESRTLLAALVINMFSWTIGVWAQASGA